MLISQYLEDRARLERAIVQHVRALRDVFNGFHADTLDAQTLTETVIDAMPAALPSERLAEELRALVSLFPLRYEGWLLVGVAYFYEHRYDQAYAALENAIAIDSRATWWHYALQIKLLADTGNSVAFQHSFNKGQNPTTYARNLALDIAENQPDGLPKHLLLGDLYLTLDDTHAAVEAYRRAVVVAPDHAPVHFGYAQALFAHHPPDPLRHRYPSYVPAMPYLAHFRKAIDLAPYRTDYRLRFVEVLLRIPENGYDPALALEHAETATHLDPYNERSWKLWARVMKYGDPQRNLSENSSNLRAALGILDRAEAYIHPNRLLFVRGILQYLLDNRQEAFLLFTRHAQAFPYYSPRLEFEEWCSQPEYFDWDVELQQFLA